VYASVALPKSTSFIPDVRSEVILTLYLRVIVPFGRVPIFHVIELPLIEVVPMLLTLTIESGTIV